MSPLNLRLRALTLAITLATASLPVYAQHEGHVMPPPPAATSKKKPPVAKPVVKPAAKPAARTPAKPAARPAAPKRPSRKAPVPPKLPVRKPVPPPVVPAAVDHSTMDHSQMQGMDHSTIEGMDHSKIEGMDPSSMVEMDHSSMEGMDHSTMEGMDHSSMNSGLPASAPPREPIPTLTPADRAAAFPDVAGHTVHDDGVHWFALLDRLETWDADEGDAIGWEALGWVGTDLDRLWIRSEGEAIDGSTDSANVELFYGRAISRWWDGVVGIRHDFGHGPSQTFAGIGVIGLSPYKFEVEATAYVGESGQTAASVEVEYDTLLTNRLILQWLVEAEAYGKDDPRRGIASGLSTVEAGVRLRYEFTRRFAPYVGVVHERAFGGTADLRRDAGEGIEDTRVVAGVRIWF